MPPRTQLEYRCAEIEPANAGTQRASAFGYPLDDTPRMCRGDAQQYSTSKYRPAAIQVLSKDQRSAWFEQRGVEINDPRYADLLDERSSYFKPFLLKWSDVKPLQVNESRWELVGAEYKHLYDFTKSHRYQRFTACGKFGGANTTAVVAHGDFYKLPFAVSRVLDGKFEGHRGKCEHDGECEHVTHTAIDANVAAIEAETQASVADIKRLQSEYSTAVAFEKDELSKSAKQALTNLWEARLRDEGLDGEELRSLKYQKNRPIPRYKDELISDLDKIEEDGNKPALPDEDALPDENGVSNHPTPVAGVEDEGPEYEEVEPEDDDVDPNNEELESFSALESETGESSSYNNDPRFSDDEEAVGPPEGHDHLVPMYEDGTRKTQEPYTHEDLEAVRGLIRLKERVGKTAERLPIVVEMIFRNRTPEEALEIHNVKANVKTAQKWKERFVEEVEMLKDNPTGIPIVPLTDEMHDVILDGGAYALVNLGNGWSYHRLETDTHANLDEAVAALKEAKICAAFRDNDVQKRTGKEHKQRLKSGRLVGRGSLTDVRKKRREARAEIEARYDGYFRHVRTIPDLAKWLKRRALLDDWANQEVKK